MNISANSGEIEIRIDKRTELLGIIEIISDYRNKYPKLLEKHGNQNYVEEIEQKFSKFKNHPVIKLFDEIVTDGNFSYDAPVSLFLELDNDFTFTSLNDYPFKKRLDSDSRIIELLKMLPDFIKEINFNDFYQANQERYKNFVNIVKQQLDANDLINFMQNYYNLPTEKKFIVNLIPFQTRGNYGTNNGENIYANIGCFSNSNTETEVYSNNGQKLALVYLLHHEFSHSFINPLTDKYDKIESNDIFKEVIEQMRNHAYGTRKTIINEHVIRALTIRYQLFITKNLDLYERLIKIEENFGFIYIRNILNSLSFYENNRDVYQNIDKYYPVILENINNEYIMNVSQQKDKR